MFNHIKAFKENNEKNYSLDFIVEGDLDVFKNILAENNIIILSSEEYTGDSETFGNITAIIQGEEQSFKLIIGHPKAPQICLILMLSGLNVTSINDKDQPVSLQQSKQLIELIKQKIKQKETTKKEEQKTQKATQTQKFSHSELQKLIEIAEKAEKEAQIIEEKAAATISPNQIKVLHELRNELQKYKRGTNADKISKTLKGLFQTMEEIEMEMIENNKETETKLIQQSMISNIDVLTEYNKRQKADKIHKVGESSLDRDDRFYAFLGKAGIYYRFLKKDMAAFAKKHHIITNGLIKIIDQSIILISIAVGIIVLINTAKKIHNINVRSMLIIIGISGIVREIWKKITKGEGKDNLRLMTIPIAALLAYIIIRLLFNTFAI